MNNTERIAEIRERYATTCKTLRTIGAKHTFDHPSYSVSVYNDLPKTMFESMKKMLSCANGDIPYLLSEVDRLTQGIKDTGKECARRYDEIQRLAADYDRTLKELDQLRKEVIHLAIESVNREKQLAKLEAEVQYWADAEEDGNLFIVSDVPQDMGDILEPLKLASALQSECRKLEFRKENKPGDVNILDYTIIAALKKCLEAALSAEGVE